ncbi:hypothetical protein FRC09_017792 [Ceratobasidium sp. 395]|nr:hypothetical protein FRC09_017792 [Ceratobasidium sp. 395]
MSSSSKVLDAHATLASTQSYDGTHSRGGVATNRHQRLVSRVKVTFTNAGNPAPCHTFHRNKPEVLLVGRDAADECGILAAPSRDNLVPLSVSKRHARIIWKNGKSIASSSIDHNDANCQGLQLRVVDLSSHNGTYFQDGTRRLEPYAAHLLTDGSVIWFGQYGEAGNRLHEPLIAKVEFVFDGEPATGSEDTQSYSVSCSSNHEQMVPPEPRLGSESQGDISGLGPASGSAYPRPSWENRANSDDNEFEYIGSDPAYEDAQGTYGLESGCMPNRLPTESPLTGKKRKHEDIEGAYDEELEQSRRLDSQPSQRTQNDEESGDRLAASALGCGPSPECPLTKRTVSTSAHMTTSAVTPTSTRRPTKLPRLALPRLALPRLALPRLGDAVIGAAIMWGALAFSPLVKPCFERA